MPPTISEFIKSFFFPERNTDKYPRRETPVEGLTRAYELIVKLANQIETHATDAPYPHIRRTLNEIARDKFDSAKNLRALIEKLGKKPRLFAGEPKIGKNHWERLNLDLRDQIALDDFLFTLELKAGERPEIAKMVEGIRSSQRLHRQILSDLVAIADPQATQT
jgi:hypothetical protein